MGATIAAGAGGEQDEYQAEEMPPPAEVQEAEGEIIGLEGQSLSPATWRAFRSAGTNPRVAEWARRVANGESVENIARESGLTVSTVKQYIINRRLLFCYLRKERHRAGGWRECIVRVGQAYGRVPPDDTDREVCGERNPPCLRGGTNSLTGLEARLAFDPESGVRSSGRSRTCIYIEAKKSRDFIRHVTASRSTSNGRVYLCRNEDSPKVRNYEEN